MEHPHQLVHSTTIPVRWGDMDALGHVNNTVYFRYAEQGRVEWLDALGVTVRLDSEEGPVIVNAHCTFLRPITYPATIEVRTLVGKPGRTSIPTFFEMRGVADDILYAEGGAKMVWWNPRTGKALPLPAFLRELYPHD